MTAMPPQPPVAPVPPRDGGAAFLLAQLGAHAAAAFAGRLEPLGLTPPQAGVLRRLAQVPGESQRALADALGMHAPRLVALIDDLEARGFVDRARDPADRRN
jgi:DNA-binding MarR family transcriptional regulator